MALAKNADWKRYDDARPRLTLRISKDDKAALDETARRRNLNISRLVIGYLRPYIEQGTPEGNRAYDIISACVQESIAWNRNEHNGGFGDTIAQLDADGNPKVVEWEGHPQLYIWPRTTPKGETVFYHRIMHRAHQRRMEAIDEYVMRLLDEWGSIPSEDARDEYLRELADKNRHRYVITYSGFKHWDTFCESYEMNLHWDFYQRPGIQMPANDEETAFVSWASDWLRDQWMKHRKKSKSNQLILNEGLRDDESGVRWGLSLGHYQTRTDNENISAWAGILLNTFRELADSISQPHRMDTIIDIIKQHHIIIKMMRIDTE